MVSPATLNYESFHTAPEKRKKKPRGPEGFAAIHRAQQGESLECFPLIMGNEAWEKHPTWEPSGSALFHVLSVSLTFVAEELGTDLTDMPFAAIHYINMYPLFVFWIGWGARTEFRGLRGIMQALYH